MLVWGKRFNRDVCRSHNDGYDGGNNGSEGNNVCIRCSAGYGDNSEMTATRTTKAVDLVQGFSQNH